MTSFKEWFETAGIVIGTLCFMGFLFILPALLVVFGVLGAVVLLAMFIKHEIISNNENK